MKRNSFKYVFYFNILLFLVIAVSLAMFRSENKTENTKSSVPVSITTPLLYSDTVSQNFCGSAGAAVIIDGKSGAILFEKNANARLPMASTTKIMTALCVLENSKPDTVIEVTKASEGIEGSSIYLRAGEKLTVEDLLYGLLLESGNDAASALAIGVFGSEQAFVDYMNKRAHEMGLIDTHFSNPHGLDGDEHYTTAYELAIITKEAMKNSLFCRIVSTDNYTVQGETPRYFSNHNRLLKMFDGASGVKTGYTIKSGRCLVSSSVCDDEMYIAVTLNDRNDWQDHMEMHTYAKDSFDSVEIAKIDDFVIYHDFKSYKMSESIYLTVSGKGDFDIGYKFTFDSEDVIGAEYFADSSKLGSFSMLKA